MFWTIWEYPKFCEGKKKIEKMFWTIWEYQLKLLHVGQLSVGTGGSLVLRSKIGRTSLGVLPWYQIEGQ
jgi:hypothetical protein